MLNRLFATVAIAILLFVFYRLTNLIIRKQVKREEAAYTAHKASSYIFWILGFILVGRTWFTGVQSLATFLGLFSAGLAIAMKDMIANVVGWIYLMTRKHFQVGDRIQIEDYFGDVLDVGVQSFTIMEIRNWVDADQSTGRLVEVPLSNILTKPVANYSKGFPFVWHEVPIIITFESDWRKAKATLEQVINDYHSPRHEQIVLTMRAARRSTMVSYSKLTPVVYTSLKENGVQLTVRFLCESRQRRNAEQDIIEQALDKFVPDNEIYFAYPTRRIYRNPDDHPQPVLPVFE